MKLKYFFFPVRVSLLVGTPLIFSSLLTHILAKQVSTLPSVYPSQSQTRCSGRRGGEIVTGFSGQGSGGEKMNLFGMPPNRVSVWTYLKGGRLNKERAASILQQAARMNWGQFSKEHTLDKIPKSRGRGRGRKK